MNRARLAWRIWNGSGYERALGGEIFLYQRGDASAIDVLLDGDTVWLK